MGARLRCRCLLRPIWLTLATISAVTDDDKIWTNGRPTRAHPRSGAGARHRCELCHGRGRLPGITKIQGKGKGMGSGLGPCPECGGSGWLSEDPDGIGPNES